MKRIFAAILAAVLRTGCQPTPEEPVIIAGGNKKYFESSGRESGAASYSEPWAD